MAYILGIDVGSGYTKAVICEGTVILSQYVMASGGNYKDTAKDTAEAALKKLNLSMNDISRTVTTGYGAGAVDFSDQTVSDIACHATGIHQLFPFVHTLIDIGAQYSKAMKINDHGKISNFILNEKCAGGSGKFLQVIARILHMEVSKIGELSIKSANPVEFTTGCAVFAESEAVSRIAEGALPEDILAGMHKAMASKIVNLVVRLGLEEECAVTGGGAKDIGLVKSIATELGTKLIVPDDPQITAAYGAALIGSSGS